MTKATISFRVAATAAGLNLTVKLDDRVIFEGDAWGGQDCSIDVEDTEADHALTFELSGKTQDHTKIDQSGGIIEDVTVSIENLAFDEIALGHIVVEQAIYTHDHNGSDTVADHKFYGVMGCNGTVRLEFSTPIYLWLLENM